MNSYTLPVKSWGLKAPISVDINITKRCNLSCSFCSADPVEVGNSCIGHELTVEELKSLFKQIEEMGVFFIRLAGGEPLIRSDIHRVLAELECFSFHKMVLTNGVPLSSRMVDSLKKANVRTIGISLDGSTAEMHDLHRGVSGTFKKIISNLQNVQNAGLKYSAQFAVTSYNVSEMIPMVEFCEKHGFTGLKLILLNLSGKARNALHFFPTLEQWSREFLVLTDFLKARKPALRVSILPPHEDPIPYELYFPLKNANRLDDLYTVWGIDLGYAHKAIEIGCAAGRTQLTVFEDGSVYGCDLMKDNSIWKAGNVREQSLKSIWDNSDIFHRLRALHKSELEGPCGTCAYEGCGGGCRASAFNLGKSINSSDSNCLLSRK